MHLRFRLAGIALTLGGLIAGTCHLFSFESSSNLSHLAQYACFGEPVHLLLFASLIVALLGWFELYSLQSPDSGVTGFAAFISMFLGILCGDLLHCILEFSVFPVLGSMVPYALPGIADATYHSAALASLIWAGKCLMFFGCAAAAMSICRSRLLAPWTAAPLALSGALLGLGLFPRLAQAINPASMPLFYTSTAVLGISVLCTTRAKPARTFDEESLAGAAVE
jgi:hypothetical protein